MPVYSTGGEMTEFSAVTNDPKKWASLQECIH